MQLLCQRNCYSLVYLYIIFLFSGLVEPLVYIRKRVRFAVPGPENGGKADQSDGMCG